MTWQQRHDDLVAHARRLVVQGLLSSSLVSINLAAGTIRDRETDQLWHYESGRAAVALHLRPQPWAEA